VDAGWDLLVVDEAHHLRWSPESASAEYRLIEELSERSEGVLLLTATPEQLGLASHFARLRLLDPDRYSDLARFEEEARSYREVAEVAGKLIGDAALTPVERHALHAILGSEPGETRARLEGLAHGNTVAREELVRDLLDRHGPGRVMFRNTRAAMKGFPRRVPRPVALDVSAEELAIFENLATEFESDLRGLSSGTSSNRDPANQRSHPLRHDPRVPWLAGLLRDSGDAKVLLIARSKEKVLALDEALKTHLTVPTGLFHEDLELIQRDRHAAWFAERDGARILLASEIGSEGRNFQFAHHLVLFDLPLDPELLEQRIGRLDRIGQKSDIHIHLPHVLNSAQEVLFRWFHESLDAFGHNLVGGRELLEQFGERVRDLAQDFHETHETRRAELDDLIAESRVARLALEERLERGRDRLLELNSYRPAPADRLVQAITGFDTDPRLEDFLLSIWDHYGVPVEDIGNRAFKIGAEGLYHEAFPGLPADGMVATLDRRVALGREDLAFLTWDHPMVTGALDLLLGGTDGNSAFALWPSAPRRDLWLQATYILECVAPAKLHADRFLAATPLRVAVDTRQHDVTHAAASEIPAAKLKDGDPRELLERPEARQRVRDMTAATLDLAQALAGPVIETALAQMEKELGHEGERMKALAAVNPAVRPSEIAAIEEQRRQLRTHLASARVRLDSVRLILMGE
jgi:ATP-dependent helicase HepA